MINKKWLIASIFIPIWGTVVNFLLLYIYYAKQKVTGYPKQLFLGGILCGLVFLVMFIVSGFVLRLVDSLGANIEFYVGMFLAFIIAGLVMNVIFVIYYKIKIENK